MSAIQEISEPIIRENITRALGDVFKTMISQESKLVAAYNANKDGDMGWPPVPVEGQECVPQVVGTVGFIGEMNGLIYLYLPTTFARICTAKMLGMTDAELDEAGDECINDAIGELTNMSVGSFKNSLCDAGYPCKLTIPSILRGSNFCVEPISTAQRYVYSFDCGGHKVVADILLKSDE